MGVMNTWPVRLRELEFLLIQINYTKNRIVHVDLFRLSCRLVPEFRMGGGSANEGRHPVIYGLTDVALLDIFLLV
jgi:hypothetical protein